MSDPRRAAHPSEHVVPRTVLVVDDDPVLLRQMTTFLREHLQFEVLAAYDYRGAIAHLASATPDVAAIDLTLPNESGYELCEYIRSRPEWMNIPILVTGEEPLPEDMAHAEEAGANVFLEKPFAMKQLGSNVRALFERPNVSRPGLRLLRLF